MRLWVDAQLSPGLCPWLRSAFAVESLHVQDMNLLPTDDEGGFMALRRQGEVVFTKDEDFIDVATRLGAPPQVLWVRAGNCSNETLKSFLLAVLPAALSALSRGDPIVEIRRRGA